MDIYIHFLLWVSLLWSLLWTCGFWLIWWVLTCAHINETITIMKIMNASITPKRFPMPLWKFILTSSLVPRLSLICCLLLSNSFHFKEFYINGTIQYILVYVWLLSFNIMILTIIHVVMYLSSLFLFKNEKFLTNFLRCDWWIINCCI